MDTFTRVMTNARVLTASLCASIVGGIFISRNGFIAETSTSSPPMQSICAIPPPSSGAEVSDQVIVSYTILVVVVTTCLTLIISGHPIVVRAIAFVLGHLVQLYIHAHESVAKLAKHLATVRLVVTRAFTIVGGFVMRYLAIIVDLVLHFIERTFDISDQLRAIYNRACTSMKIKYNGICESMKFKGVAHDDAEMKIE